MLILLNYLSRISVSLKISPKNRSKSIRGLEFLRNYKIYMAKSYIAKSLKNTCMLHFTIK